VHDGDVDAAAIRIVDLQKKYHRSAFDMADDLGLTRPRANALRIHLGVDADPNLTHTFDSARSTSPDIRIKHSIE
jgi:hypothetical protein